MDKIQLDLNIIKPKNQTDINTLKELEKLLEKIGNQLIKDSEKIASLTKNFHGQIELKKFNIGYTNLGINTFNTIQEINQIIKNNS